MGNHRKLFLWLPAVAVWLCAFSPTVFPGVARNKPLYRCPLKKHNGFSSAFQDFRAGHFHAGVDFRTFQRTGLPVYAISAGHVVRLRMVRLGSGRGIYLRHHDGNTSLYFHLQRFAPRLEAILEARQQQLGKRYVGNVKLEPPIKVEAGQLIGYSGETGYGFPHLHLEIRDHEGTRLNPFPLVMMNTRDRNPPRMEILVLRTQADGMINGRVGELRLPLQRRGGKYQVVEPIVVTGGLEAVVGGRDISDTGRYVAPWKVSARLDGEEVFKLAFERFTWADNNQLGFVYDMRDSSPSRFFFNLFTQPDFSMESSGIGLGKALERHGPGTCRVELEWQDHFGNRSLAGIDLEKRPVPALRIASISRRTGILVVKIDDLKAPGAERVDFTLQDADGCELFTYPLDTSAPFPVSLELMESRPAALLTVRWVSRGIAYALRRFSVAPQPQNKLERIVLDPWIAGDNLLLKVRQPILGEENLRMRPAMAGGDWKLPFSDVDGLVFRLLGKEVARISNGDEHLAVLHFALFHQGSPRAMIQESLRLLRLEPERHALFRWGEFEARFWPRSVRIPRLMRAEKQNLPAEWPLLSPQIRLAPESFAFLDRVEYTFTRKVPQPHQAAVFRWLPRLEKWRYVSTRFDSNRHRYTTRVRASGTYALMRDNVPPAISFVRIRGSALPRITITDLGTGVDDLSVRVWLDGLKIDAEYDPDRRWVRFPDSPPLKSGLHHIKVECLDRARNRGQRAWRWKSLNGRRKSG